VLRQSNEGGTCEIYHVHHPKLRLRAIARVARRTILEKHPWIRERILNNAEIISESNHSNLLRILDLGETREPTPRPFVITERIVGRDLAAYLASHGQLPVATVIDIGLQITRGLAELERLGLSHGDLKPSNIMISLRTNGALRVVLIDFDLARHLEAPRSPGLSPGTPNYLPPEHSIGMRPSIHFDIYALGVILHELLLGECPVDEQRCLAAIKEQTEWPMICPLHIEHPELGVPRSLSRLIARLAHRDRCRRPKSLAEVEGSIERLRSPAPAIPSRNNHALTLRPSIRASVKVALSTEAAKADAAPMDEPTPTQDRRRTILPVILDLQEHSADASSWHHGVLLDPPLADERITSPLRELRRGRITTLLALVAVVSVLSIVTWTARVVTITELPADDAPQANLSEYAAQAPHATLAMPTGRRDEEQREASEADPSTEATDAADEEPSPATRTPRPRSPRTRQTHDEARPPTPDADDTDADDTDAESPAPDSSDADSPPVWDPALFPVHRRPDSATTPVVDPNADVELPTLTRPADAAFIIAPKLIGMQVGDARASLRSVGVDYRVRQATVGDCFFREGEVIAQSFAPGTAIEQSQRITIDYCMDEENEREEEKRHGYATVHHHAEPDHRQGT